MHFQGNTATCPYCGGEALLADFATDATGDVHWLRDAYTILTGPGLSQLDRARLTEQLERARIDRTAPAQVAARVAQTSPELAQLLDRVVPKDANAFWTMMGVLVALLAFIRSCAGGPPAQLPPHVIAQVTTQPTTQVINQITNTTVVNDYGERRTAALPTSPTGPPNGVTRPAAKRRADPDSPERRARMARAAEKRARRAQRRCGPADTSPAEPKDEPKDRQ